MHNYKKLEVLMGLYSSTTGFISSTYGAIEDFWKQPNINWADRAAPLIEKLEKGGSVLISAGTQAAQGNYKKAGEILAGPPKEPPFDIRKVITSAAQLKAMETSELVAAIQKDPALPKTLNIQGQETTLVDAMEDRNFRTGFIRETITTAKKDPSLNVRVAALKEYSRRIENAEALAQQQILLAMQQQATIATPPVTVEAEVPAPAATAAPVTQTATFASALVKPSATAPTATTDTNQQYKSMSLAQLVTAIRDDPTLPETARVGDVDIRLSSALRDKDFRATFADELAKAKIGGVDTSQQIAMVEAYDGALKTQKLALTMAQDAKINMNDPALTLG